MTPWTAPSRSAGRRAFSRCIARELLDRGTCSSCHDAAVSYPDANALFDR